MVIDGMRLGVASPSISTTWIDLRIQRPDLGAVFALCDAGDAELEVGGLLAVPSPSLTGVPPSSMPGLAGVPGAGTLA